MNNHWHALTLPEMFFQRHVGGDRLYDLVENLPTVGKSFPPYDIVKTGENSYRIDMALAGYSSSDIDITQEKRVLTVSGHKNKEERPEDEVHIHRGIATRDFQTRWTLDEHVEVKAVKFDNAILTIQLEREIPEEEKPRTFQVGYDAKPAIEGKKVKRVA